MLNSITWQGREIVVVDWDCDRSGNLVFLPHRINWDGTAEGLSNTLRNYLDSLPDEDDFHWPKTSIEKLGLSGNLWRSGTPCELVIFPMRSLS